MNESYGSSRPGEESLNYLVSNAETESLWIDDEDDEGDDDDMDFEPEADSLDLDAGLFNPSEDADIEFHGSITAS